MGKSKTTLQVWQIAKVNLRHNFLPLLLLAVVIMILTPILFGTTGLDSKAAAVPLEMLISIIGIILLVPIFQPEQDEEIRDLVASKYVDSTYVHLIRVIYSIIGIVLLVMVFSIFMIMSGCEITIELIGGTIADAMFLGAIGLFTSAVTSNAPVSFMIPLLYYVLNLTMKSRFGNFNLFSMMSSDYHPNIWLFVSSIAFIVIAVLIKRGFDKKYRLV